MFDFLSGGTLAVPVVQQLMMARGISDPTLLSMVESVMTGEIIQTKAGSLEGGKGGTFTPREHDEVGVVTVEKADEDLVFIVVRRKKPTIAVDSSKSP